MPLVQAHFRPEFLNRVDDTVVFQALRREHMRDIAEIQLNRLRQRLADQELGLMVDDGAVEVIVDQGFDPVFGARPMKRAIQRLMENPLANALLEGRFQRGQTLVARVDDQGDALAFDTAS